MQAHERQVIIGLLAPDQRSDPEAVATPDSEGQQQERPVRGVPEQDDARLKGFVSREGFDVGPHPVEALVGRAGALGLHRPPERFDGGKIVKGFEADARGGREGRGPERGARSGREVRDHRHGCGSPLAAR